MNVILESGRFFLRSVLYQSECNKLHAKQVLLYRGVISLFSYSIVIINIKPVS